MCEACARGKNKCSLAEGEFGATALVGGAAEAVIAAIREQTERTDARLARLELFSRNTSIYTRNSAVALQAAAGALQHMSIMLESYLSTIPGALDEMPEDPPEYISPQRLDHDKPSKEDKEEGGSGSK